MRPVLVDEIDRDEREGRAVGVGMRHIARSGVGVSQAVVPVDDERGHGIVTGIGDRAKRQRVQIALGKGGRAGERNGRGDVGDLNGERPCVEVRPVLVDEIDRDERRGRAVGVGVRHVACGGVGVRQAVVPVDDERSHGIVAGVGDRAECQRVQVALRDGGVTGERDGRRHVFNDDQERVAGRLVAAVRYADFDSEGAVIGIGVIASDRACATGLRHDSRLNRGTVTPVDRSRVGISAIRVRERGGSQRG